MAACVNDMYRYNMLFVYCLFLCIYEGVRGTTHLYEFRPADVISAHEQSCLLLADNSANEGFVQKLLKLQDIFKEEDSVFIGLSDLSSFKWPSGEELHWKYSDIPVKYQHQDVAFFAKMAPDRTCLYRPSHTLVLHNPMPEYVGGPREVDALLQFLNYRCGTFRMPGGHLSPAGLHRQDILDNLFHTETISDTNMGELYSTHENPLNKSFAWFEDNKNNDHCDSEGCDPEDSSDKYTNHENEPTKMAECERINLPLSQDEFFHNYLKRSKPVIIQGAAKHWEAFSKWSPQFLRENFGNEDVHIKMTPGGDYEGVEPITMWENYDKFSIPDEVKQALQYPDLVVVRPAGVNMKFSKFLDLVELAATQPEKNVSAYLEYSSIKDYMPELLEDLQAFDFAKDLLTLKHLNMWLSDGNTLGRLHFDAYDNLLCQLRGQKQVVLFEPFDNEALYEGHIQQATLSYNHTGGMRFSRKHLEESTSMVMSPIDLLSPNFERFPKFASTHPLNCTIGEGDVLYMPAFWWHEVQSSPNVEEKRNLAVNYWYEPFLTREFPCPDCKMDVNPHYYHLLD